jgi:hypothetical protein
LGAEAEHDGAKSNVADAREATGANDATESYAPGR